MQTNQILSGLKVVELASVLAGPSVGQFLAECGAEVIKIENPATQGDVTRSWKLPKEDPNDSRSAYFSAANWGKKSLAVDITQAEGYKVLKEMVAEADITVSSYKPGDDTKLRTDYQTLSKLNPRLIYGHITGYGRGHDKVGYDAIIQAESGLMYLNGEPGGASLKMPVALVDVLAAHHLKEGILLALIQRMHQGKGAYVEVSLFQAALCSLVNQATNYLQAGHDPEKMGSEHPNIAPYGRAYTTADGAQIVLAVGTDKQFATLCHLLEIPALALSPNFATNAQRVANRTALNQQLERAFGRYEAEDLVKQLDRLKIPAGRINRVSDALQMALAKDLLLENGNYKGIRQLCARIDGQLLNVEEILAPAPFLSKQSF